MPCAEKYHCKKVCCFAINYNSVEFSPCACAIVCIWRRRSEWGHEYEISININCRDPVNIFRRDHFIASGHTQTKIYFFISLWLTKSFFLCLWNKIMFISRSLRAYCLLACYFGLFQHSQHIHIFLSKSKDEWKPLYFRKLVFLSFEKHFMLLMMMMMCFEFWLYALRVVEFFKIVKIILSQTSAS